jgi:hypothetical protein
MWTACFGSADAVEFSHPVYVSWAVGPLSRIHTYASAPGFALSEIDYCLLLRRAYFRQEG